MCSDRLSASINHNNLNLKKKKNYQKNRIPPNFILPNKKKGKKFALPYYTYCLRSWCRISQVIGYGRLYSTIKCEHLEGAFPLWWGSPFRHVSCRHRAHDTSSRVTCTPRALLTKSTPLPGRHLRACVCVCVWIVAEIQFSKLQF